MAELKTLDDLIIPRSILKNIFFYLDYKEVVKLRYVCRHFNQVASELLNDSFLQLNLKINSRLEKTADILKEVLVPCQNVIKYFKIISFLRTENNMLKAVVQKYIEESLFTFTGGKILDQFNMALQTDYERINHSFEYIKIFHLVGTYLDYFDTYIEPGIIEKNEKFLMPWFGVKLINILDASLDLNHRLELSYGPDCIYMEGEYDGEELFLFENLPNMNSKMLDKDKRNFIQCVRNNIKWNNLLYCIERSTTELARAYYEPELQMNSHNNKIFQKTVINTWKYESPGVSYAISIKCNQGLLPLRLSGLSMKNDYSYLRNIFCTTTDKSTPHEFNLIMKVRTRLEEGQLKEKIIKLYNVGLECIVAEVNKLQQIINL